MQAFRGTMHLRWEGRAHANPFYITVVSMPTSATAAAVGMWLISQVLNPPRFDLAAMRASARATGGDEVYVRVYASSGATLYAAGASYSMLTGDRFHAIASLRSLCPPPGAASAPSAAAPAGIATPAGWTAAGALPESSYSDLTPIAPGPETTSLESVSVSEGSDTSEYITPDRAERFCGQDGWHTVLRGVHRGYPYLVETLAGYANDNVIRPALHPPRRGEDRPRGAAAVERILPLGFGQAGPRAHAVAGVRRQGPGVSLPLFPAISRPTRYYFGVRV